MFRPKNSCHIKIGMSEPRFESFTLIFNVMEISPLAAVPLIARQKHAYINLLVYIYMHMGIIGHSFWGSQMLKAYHTVRTMLLKKKLRTVYTCLTYCHQ